MSTPEFHAIAILPCENLIAAKVVRHASIMQIYEAILARFQKSFYSKRMFETKGLEVVPHSTTVFVLRNEGPQV